MTAPLAEEQPTEAMTSTEKLDLVGFALIVVILLTSACASIYHAGWMDGFHECERIFTEPNP